MSISRRQLLSWPVAAAAAPMVLPRQDAPAVVDLPRHGIKSLAAVGSIELGSDQLMLVANPGFRVGDYIVVETGGEMSAGAPGGMGVGGAWPALNYATTSVLLADASQPNGAFAWAQDTGDVYQCYSGAWTPTSTSSNWRYWWKCIPRALLARVAAVSGRRLTLDRKAAASAAGANVYYNNSYPLNALIAAGGNDTSYVFPAGTFWFGDTAAIGANSGSVISIMHKSGVRLGGQGKGRTVLRSPKGSTSFEIGFFEAPNGAVGDLTIYGNFFLDRGYGFNYKYSQSAGIDIRAPGIPNGIYFQRSDSCTARDVDFQHSARCVVGQDSSRCSANRCSQFMDGSLSYLQWSFDWVNCSGCYSYDCVSNSSYLKQTFECFASNDCGHIRPTTTNGVMALNSAGGCVLDAPKVTITADSQLNNSFAVSPGGAIFDINTNIPQNAGRSANKVLNMDVTVLGYCNAQKQQLVGVNISGQSAGTLVSGGIFRGMDYANGGDRGPQAVNADTGQIGTIVEGLTVTGAPNANFGGNINVQNGKVIGCTAPQITCPGPACSPG